MEEYLIVEEGIIKNIIICENQKDATVFDAVPYYKDATIGEQYHEPMLEPTHLDKIEAQIMYTALKTGTLINGGNNYV